VLVDWERRRSIAEEMDVGSCWGAAGWYGMIGGSVDSADGRRGDRALRSAGVEVDVEEDASATGGREVVGGGRGAVVWRCRKLGKRDERAVWLADTMDHSRSAHPVIFVFVPTLL